MDFHSLTRRELQTLCKKNKIPANMTNVAMADALAALENVEGLEELTNQSQSPEKAVPESPSIPRTVIRTSTRRKPVKEDPETAQPPSRTRRTTRRTLDKDLDQENQNVNVPETPAMASSRRRAPAASATKKIDAQVKEDVGQEEVSYVVETPAVHTGRRRAQVGSARRKLEEGSVQHVHSTRRSVRLLEKTMADLILNEKDKAVPLKMDALDEIKETDASAESLEKNNDTVASFIESLEDELKPVEDVHEKDKSNDNEVENRELMGTQNSVNLDNHSVSDARDDETCDKSDDLLGDNSDKATSNDIGPVDVSVPEFVSETENASVEVVMEPEDSVAAKGSDETSAKVVAGATDVPVTEFESDPEKASDEVVVKEEDSLASNEISGRQVEELHSAELKQKDLEVLYPEDKKSEEDSELLDFKIPEADSDQFVSESSAAAQNLQPAFECAEKENYSHDNDVAAASSFDDPNIEVEEFNAEELVDVNLIESEEVPISYDNETSKLDNPEIKKEEFDTEGLVDVKLVEGNFSISDEDKSPNTNPDFENEEFDIEGLLDANLPEAEVPMYSEKKTPESVKQITPSCLGNVLVSLPIESFSGDKSPGYCPVSGGKFSGRNPMSPWGTDSISSQFPRPTQSTPKSASKKQGTAQKLTTITADNNKENIDTSGRQLESKKEKVKKNKNTINDDSLNDASLRQLTKMLKEKLQITNKKLNNEEQNTTQPQVVGKRSALQPLPENLVHPGEPNRETD